MRCPWYLFHRFFGVWARTQGHIAQGPHELSVRPWSVPSSVPPHQCQPVLPHQCNLSVLPHQC
ncbi:unnamed protein product, partial [Staurois parvus]